MLEREGGWGGEGFKISKTDLGKGKRSRIGWEFLLENIPKNEDCQEVERGRGVGGYGNRYILKYIK